MIKLLDAVSVNTNGTKQKSDGASKNLSVWATSFGTGKVTFQVSPNDGVTWITPKINGNPAEFTEDSSVKVDFVGQGQHVRAILTGANGSTSNVNAVIA